VVGGSVVKVVDVVVEVVVGGSVVEVVEVVVVAPTEAANASEIRQIDASAAAARPKRGRPFKDDVGRTGS